MNLKFAFFVFILAGPLSVVWASSKNECAKEKASECFALFLRAFLAGDEEGGNCNELNEIPPCFRTVAEECNLAQDDPTVEEMLQKVEESIREICPEYRRRRDNRVLMKRSIKEETSSFGNLKDEDRKKLNSGEIVIDNSNYFNIPSSSLEKSEESDDADMLYDWLNVDYVEDSDYEDENGAPFDWLSNDDEDYYEDDGEVSKNDQSKKITVDNSNFFSLPLLNSLTSVTNGEDGSKKILIDTIAIRESVQKRIEIPMQNTDDESKDEEKMTRTVYRSNDPPLPHDSYDNENDTYENPIIYITLPPHILAEFFGEDEENKESEKENDEERNKDEENNKIEGSGQRYQADSCLDRNSEYLMNCLQDGPVRAAEALGGYAGGELDMNLYRCATTLLTQQCTIERAEEKCGARVANDLRQTLGDQIPEDACNTQSARDYLSLLPSNFIVDRRRK